MVKMLQLLSVTSGIAAGDDVTSLLQQTQSVGNRILAAVANGSGDTICVEAAVGDIAPVPGSFTAATGQQAVEVAAGTAAEENGSFCVAKAAVLLLQRTHSLHTANDIESALTTKDSTTTTATTATTATTTTMTTTTLAADPCADNLYNRLCLPNAANFDQYPFADKSSTPWKKVMVKQCPNKSSTLTQMMEVTVSKKGNQATANLDADQKRLCACRNFLKDGVQHIYGLLNDHAGEAIAAAKKAGRYYGDVKADLEAIGVTTVPTVADFGMVCKQASALKDWPLIAKMINHPTEVVPNLKAANITGQEHCAKGWIIEGACAEIVKETSLLQHKLSTEDKIDSAIHRATSDLPKATSATVAEVDDMVEAFSQDLMETSTALTQVSVTQQEALLRRAFQSAEVSNFVEGYINLPEETKHKVVNSALSSEDLVEVFEAMPTAERTALLVQLDGNQMDKAVGQKTETKVTNDQAGNRKTETVTKDGNGNVVHSHTHVHNARTGQTETATRSKQHRHNHKHNSNSAQTETQTASAGHTHGHVTNAKTGVTVTDSTGANGYQHHHDHTHTHQNGVTATATNSRTRADGGAQDVTATHSHVQNKNGNRWATATVTGGTSGTHVHNTR